MIYQELRDIIEFKKITKNLIDLSINQLEINARLKTSDYGVQLIQNLIPYVNQENVENNFSTILNISQTLS